MKFQKIVLILVLIFTLMMPVVSASNINGWGSLNFFGTNQPNTLFTSAVTSDLYNDSVSIAATAKPVVCNIDTSTTENELLLYSGTNVEMYSGIGRALTLIGTYTAADNINSVGCIGNRFFVANDDRLEDVTYNDETETFSTIATLDTALDVSCSYDNNLCIVLYNNGFEFYNISGVMSGLGYTNGSFNFVVGDRINFADDNSVYIYDDSLRDVHILNSSSSAPTHILYTRDLSEPSSAYLNKDVEFIDFLGNGEFQFCGLSYKASTDATQIHCFDSDNALINSIGRASITGAEWNIIPLNPTKTNNVMCQVVYSTAAAAREHACYDAYDDTFSNIYTKTATGYASIENSFFFFDENNTFSMMQEDKVYVLSGTSWVLQYDIGTGVGNTLATDITGDTKPELFFVGSTQTTVLFDEDVDPAALPAVVTYASNAVDGGYFGYYTSDICVGTNITFEALECVGDLEFCNYYNPDPLDQERLATNCGLGGGLNYGSWDSTNPTITCEYSTPGDYEVVIYIQDSNELTNTNNENAPISITVADTAGCNDANLLISQPPNTGEATTDSGSGSAPEGEAAPNGDTTEEATILEKIRENWKLLLGFLIIVIGLATLWYNNVKSPYILMVAAILLLVVTNMLGLIDFIITIFLVIAFVVIGLVVGAIFKPRG